MEKELIDAIRLYLPEIDIYHDFAPEESEFPLIIVQRLGGSGNRFVDHDTDGGYEMRFTIASWADGRMEANRIGEIVENALNTLSCCVPVAAPESMADTDTGRRGVVQDFLITG